MEKPAQNSSFARRTVGDVTRGGFSALVSDAEAGITTVLYKWNEPVAVMMPCNRAMEAGIEMSAGAAAFAATAKSSGVSGAVIDVFLRSLIESAAVAKMILGVDSNDAGQILEQKIIEAYSSLIRTNSAEGTALSRHDNRSAVVSEVKEEGLDSSPSLSRKRSKKRPSSP